MWFTNASGLYIIGLFYFSSSLADPEVAESGIQGVQADPQILGQPTCIDLSPTLSPTSDDIDTSQSPDAVVETKDVTIDINQLRFVNCKYLFEIYDLRIIPFVSYEVFFSILQIDVLFHSGQKFKIGLTIWSLL